MKLSVQFLWIALSLVARDASAQAQISGPVMGYVFDPAGRSIRPVRGTPGASLVGEPLDLGLAMASAAVAPQQSYAVVVGAQDSLVRAVTLSGEDAGSRLMPQAASDPRQTFFSPGGGALALYAPATAALQVFTQVPGAPALVHEISLAGVAGELRSAAITDDGEVALILTGGGDDAGAWLSVAGGDPVRLQGAALSAAAFRRGSHDLLIAAQDGEIRLRRQVETNSDVQVLAPADGRTADAVAVRFSADGAYAYAATRQGTVAGFGIETGSTAFLSCRCTPSGLVPFTSPTLWRLNEVAAGPLMLLDTANPEPRIWFVPALNPDMASERSGQ